MNAPAIAAPEKTPFWSALFTDRRIAPALGLGFTSGIPFLLVYATQSAWLCLRLGRADHLHVDAGVHGARGEPIRSADLALCLPQQRAGRLLRLHRRADGLLVVLSS